MNTTPASPAGTTVIVSARITPLPTRISDPMPRVMVTDAHGQETFLFEYYPNEISFTEAEFVGLSIEQARKLKYQKDRAYLRS